MNGDEQDDITRALTDALQATADDGFEPVVSDLQRLSGGASRETWAFDAVLAHGDAPRRLILQRTRPGAAFSGPSMLDEDHLLVAAVAAGVPVPPVVLDAAACAPHLGEARVTTFVDGEALGPRIVRGEGFAPARALLVGQCAQALAAIHSIDPAAVSGLEEIEPLARLRDGLDLLDEARPAFEVALRWLAQHRPPTRPTTVVHGDFRMGNLLVDPADGLRAVLDWELAHLGDPLEDLGWLCIRAWRFGGTGEVGGVGPLDDLIDAYGAATGAPVDIEHVRWWMVAGTLTWGLICAVQARRHLDGQVQSVELATIGRRVAETEYDLCRLLDIGDELAALADRDCAGVDADEAHGLAMSIERPTAAELVDAVRTHLVETLPSTLDDGAAFQIKVAANALAIVERELLRGSTAQARAADRLARIAMTDERALAAAVRNATIDGTNGRAADTIRTLVVDRLHIANPRWLQTPDA